MIKYLFIFLVTLVPASLLAGEDYVYNDELYLQGQINNDTYNIIKNYLDWEREKGDNIAMIHLRSEGGWTYEMALIINKMISFQLSGGKIVTLVPLYAYSAAANIFLFGDVRKLGKRAELGFHHSRTINKLTPNDPNMNCVWLRIFNLSGQDILNKLFPANGSMTFVRKDDALKWNLATEIIY